MNRMDSERTLRTPRQILKAQIPFMLPALGASIALCTARYHSAQPSFSPLLSAGALFVVLFLVFKLFALGVSTQVSRELADYATEQVDERRLYIFVFYKELIKAIIGVSALAAWGAGLLLIPDLFPIPFPAIGGLGLLITLTILALCYGLVNFVDGIRYPVDH